MSEQIPPADEFADVRNQIRVLEKRREELRGIILSDKSARTGNRYLAEVVTVTQTRVDLKELRQMHPALVEEYTFPTEAVKIELRVVTEDGEIIPRPREPRS